MHINHMKIILARKTVVQGQLMSELISSRRHLVDLYIIHPLKAFEITPILTPAGVGHFVHMDRERGVHGGKPAVRGGV